jgi:hypothetical protein
MELNILDNGLMTSKMVLVRKFGQILLNIKDSICKEKSTEKEDLNGLMDQFMKENF